MSHSFRLDDCQLCPGCNTELSQLSGPDREPATGNLVICLHCFTPLQVVMDEAKNFSLKKISIKDFEAMDDDQKASFIKAHYQIEHLRWLQTHAN